MFISNIYSKELINKAAKKIGCEVGETLGENGYGKPAITGKTFAIKEQLKSSGARWDGLNKVWTFESWEELEQAIKICSEGF
jgi:hypothetical protein